jgi:SAM-dependent methyltransferase
MARWDPTYSRYASHYDQIGQRRFGEVSADSLLAYLGDKCVNPNTVLDLACGTGAATLQFARRGLTATGLDISEAMLERARASAEADGLRVQWKQGDMTAFVVDEPFDLCTCFYDAVNYLSDLKEFTSFVRCAFDALVPGGYLAFDINTRRKLEEHWGEMTLVAADDGDRFLAYRSWFDEVREVSPLVITGFERRPDGAWDRFDEEHLETAFRIEDLTARSMTAGFRVVDVLDWQEGHPAPDRAGTEKSFRVMFVANKPGIDLEA